MSDRDPAFDYPPEIQNKIERARKAAAAFAELLRLMDNVLAVYNKIDAALEYNSSIVKTLKLEDSGQRKNVRDTAIKLKENMRPVIVEAEAQVESLKADVEKAINRHRAEVVMFPPKADTAE